MLEYCANEFLGMDITPNTLAEEVDKKVSLLYDFCILHQKSHRPRDDRREPLVRKVLMECNSEQHMTRVLRPVILGECTLEDLLQHKGVI